MKRTKACSKDWLGGWMQLPPPTLQYCWDVFMVKPHFFTRWCYPLCTQDISEDLHLSEYSKHNTAFKDPFLTKGIFTSLEGKQIISGITCAVTTLDSAPYCLIKSWLHFTCKFCRMWNPRGSWLTVLPAARPCWCLRGQQTAPTVLP